METISIPMSEYQSLKKEVQLLENQALLAKLNEVIDLMFESKYGLYLGNYTEDLAESSIAEIKA